MCISTLLLLTFLKQHLNKSFQGAQVYIYLTSLNHILEGINIANLPVSQDINTHLAMSITGIFIKSTKIFLSSILLQKGKNKIQLSTFMLS